MLALTGVLRLVVVNRRMTIWMSTGIMDLGLAASRMADMVSRITPAETHLVDHVDDIEHVSQPPLQFSVRYPLTIR